MKINVFMRAWRHTTQRVVTVMCVRRFASGMRNGLRMRSMRATLRYSRKLGSMRTSYNVVVISDLHLGEDLSIDASEQSRRDVAMASAAAADFLIHLTQRRVDGLPW